MSLSEEGLSHDNGGVTRGHLRPRECSTALRVTCNSSWGGRGSGIFRGKAARGRTEVERAVRDAGPVFAGVAVRTDGRELYM